MLLTVSWGVIDNEQPGFVVETGKSQVDTKSRTDGEDEKKQSALAPPSDAVSATTREEGEEETTQWPIFIRPSISGKDISVDLPRTAPFMTLHQVRQQIEPQLQTASPRIRFIYLGKIVPESTTLIPNASTSSSASGSLLLDKQAVIQAMVSANVGPH